MYVLCITIDYDLELENMISMFTNLWFSKTLHWSFIIHILVIVLYNQLFTRTIEYVAGVKKVCTFVKTVW